MVKPRIRLKINGRAEISFNGRTEIAARPLYFMSIKPMTADEVEKARDSRYWSDICEYVRRLKK